VKPQWLRLGKISQQGTFEMSKLSESWKKAKDAAEKLCKQKQKEGRKAEFPKFKSDFQKHLEKFEASHELIEKIKQKLEEEQKNLRSYGKECESIIKEYEKAIDSAEVEGLKSKEEVKDPMLKALTNIGKVVEAWSKA
jgi:uncharacterized protein YaaN involved in tellurite resistance